MGVAILEGMRKTRRIAFLGGSLSGRLRDGLSSSQGSYIFGVAVFLTVVTFLVWSRF